MKGYYKNDKDTHKVLDEKGWLHTGDMATMDPDGTLYIRGRSRALILPFPASSTSDSSTRYMLLSLSSISSG